MQQFLETGRSGSHSGGVCHIQEEAGGVARLQAVADADDEARAGAAGEEGETRRFWVRSADFAAVAVYVRQLVGERPPHHLLPVQQFLETAGRVYTAGEIPMEVGESGSMLQCMTSPQNL